MSLVLVVEYSEKRKKKKKISITLEKSYFISLKKWESSWSFIIFYFDLNLIIVVVVFSWPLKCQFHLQLRCNFN